MATALICCHSVTFASPLLEGKFVQSGDNVYQYYKSGQDSTTQVVITENGIFISTQPKDSRIPINSFDPLKLDPANNYSLFLRFKNRYKELVTAGGTFALTGSLNINIPETDLSIFIDQERKFCGVLKKDSNNPNQYTMLVTINNEIAGTINDLEIINILTNENAKKKSIDFYTINQRGELKYREKILPSGLPIGIAQSHAEHICQSGKYKFINQNEYAEIKSQINTPKAKSLIEKSLSNYDFKSLLILSSNSERIIGYDNSLNSIVMIKIVGKTAPLCLISEIKI